MNELICWVVERETKTEIEGEGDTVGMENLRDGEKREREMRYYFNELYVEIEFGMLSVL